VTTPTKLHSNGECPVCRIRRDPPPADEPGLPFIAALVEVEVDGIEAVKNLLCETCRGYCTMAKQVALECVAEREASGSEGVGKPS
jgi:hypothetical protein